MEIVIEVGAGRDEKVDQSSIHQLDETSTQASRSEGTGHGEPDSSVVLWIEHLVREDFARLGQARRVEGLKALRDQTMNVGTSGRPVIPNGFPREQLRFRLSGRAWRAVRQAAISFFRTRGK